MMKSVLKKIFDVLKHVVHLSINQDVFPENMKIACVTPNFKSGDEYLLTNYRPQHRSQYCHFLKYPKEYLLQQSL